MDAITKLLTELKDLGFSKEQVEELLDIAEQEIRDAVLEDLAYNGEEAKVQEYLQKFEAVKSDPQGFATTFDEAMGTLYGAENVQSKKDEMLVAFLTNIVDLTKKTKDLYQKYSQGDPNTVKAVEEANASPITQDLVGKMQQDHVAGLY